MSSYNETAQKLIASVNDEGEIGNETANILFSSFNDRDIWSQISIDCSMPKSSFYIAKLNHNLIPTNVNNNANDDDENQDDNVYIIVRYTNDDISKYLDYLKFEYHSYLSMDGQVNEIICPIGYIKNISQDGFLFAFLTSTNRTLEDAIDDMKDLPLQSKFTYIINLIDIIYESNENAEISGFHITPKTILIDLQNSDESIGMIGFVGGINDLKLCQEAIQFSYNNDFSPAELKKKVVPTIIAPSIKSDVYGLAKIVQFIVGDELPIPAYKEVMISAFQKNQSNRLSLDDFKNQMLEIQKKVLTMEENQVQEPHQIQAPPVNINEPVPPPIIQNVRLVDKIRDFCTLLKTEEGCPQVYKLPQIITKVYQQKKIRKVIVGPQTCHIKDEIKILIVGQTGSGKTTFLNGIANYLYSVRWEDNCRFKIVSDEDEGEKNNDNNQAISQTDYVTAYTFPWQPDFPVQHTVTLIDTPGFGDTRGLEQDKKIVEQLDSLFKNQNDCGVDSLNAVAFVAQSGAPRLDKAQQYIFDSIMTLFGNDIGKNIIIIATFADGGDPKVLSAIKMANIPINYVSKFNNSALFAKRSKFNEFFWEIGQDGYLSLFDNINKMNPKTLSLTQNVLDERKKLHVSIDGLSRQIREGIAQMEVIEQECRIIEQCKTDIRANKNFTKRIKVIRDRKVNLKPGEHVTNCSHCHKTCHYPCYIPNDSDKKGCAAMNSKGYCNICKCHWNLHFNMAYRWESYETEEVTTLDELKKKYGDAKSKKQTRQKMLENAQNKYQNIFEATSQLVTCCKNCVVRLQQIALRPLALSEIDYIEIQIESEKQACQPGWNTRVKWLEELLEQQKLIEAISQGKEKEILPHQKIKIKNKRIMDFLREKIGFNF